MEYPTWLFEFAQTIFSTILGSILKLFTKSGDIKLVQKFFKVFYTVKNFNSTVCDFLIELSFYNTSSVNVVIYDIEILFYDGERYNELKFEGHNLAPVITLPANNTIDLSYKLLPKSTLLNPLLSIYQDIAFVEIKYKIKSEQKSEFIYSSAIHLEDKTPKYSIY